MVYNKTLKKLISLICLLLSLSFPVLMFSGCNADSKDKVLTTILNRDGFVVNGHEYVLVINDKKLVYDGGMSYSLINNGTWSWESSRDKMNEIGKIRIVCPGDWSIAAKRRLYASNEDPPIYLYIADDNREVCYMLKGHTLPSMYTSSFTSIDFRSNIEDLYFASPVSMEDIISYENPILDEDCEIKHISSADLYYSENDIIYLDVDIYRINDGFYIRLDDVYYPIVMPEILDRLNAAK